MELSTFLNVIGKLINTLISPISTQTDINGGKETIINTSFILFWVIVGIVAIQYRRIARHKEYLVGIKVKTVIRDTVTATVYGIIGGVLGSVLLNLTNVSLSEGEVIFLWPIAIILAFINPRFLCFSYAGGIISLSYLLFGYPQVRVPQLMALVAILHMVESLLILGSGHLGATPIYTKNKEGQMVGGYTLQKFWPIPLTIMVLNSGLQPVVAALGYSDLAIARKPAEKSKISAFYLGLFSLVLLVLSLLANNIATFAWCAALFSPLGHELVIYWGQRLEYKSPPIFTAPENGIKVLAAFPDTPAENIGLQMGDVIYTINGYKVSNKYELESILSLYQPEIELEFIDEKGHKRKGVIKGEFGNQLGILLVPDGTEDSYVELNTRGLFKNWWHKIKGHF